MTVAKVPSRPFDIREGARKYNICIRLNKAEIMHLDKMCEKTGESRSAIIMKYFNESRKKTK